MPHARLDRVQAAPPPVAAPANAELHKSVHPGPSHSDDADAMSKNKLIPSSHLSLDGSSTGGAGQYGVLRAAGGALGLNKFAEDSAHDKKAKPLSKALTKFMTAHNPKTAWSHAIVLVSIIGGRRTSLVDVLPLMYAHTLPAVRAKTPCVHACALGAGDCVRASVHPLWVPPHTGD